MSANLLKQLKRIDSRIKSVVDASGPLEVEVSARDVKNSTRKDATGCALAVACMEKTHPLGVIVNRSRFYLIDEKGVAHRYNMPVNAKREITSFDRGASFSPGTYVMHELQPSQKLRRRNTQTHHQSEQKNQTHPA